MSSLCFIPKIPGFFYFSWTLDNVTSNCIWIIPLSRSSGAEEIGYTTLIGDDINILVQYHKYVSL